MAGSSRRGPSSDPEVTSVSPASWPRTATWGKLHTVKVGVPGRTQQPAELEIPVPSGLDYDTWVGPAPMIPYTAHRCANTYGWMLNYNFVVGFISGWGVHHLDIALWGMGDRATGPVEVQGTGALPNGGFNDTWLSWLVEFKYADGLKLSFSNNGNPHPMGCRFEGDKGWVFVSRRGIQAQPESLLKVAIQPNETHLYQSNHHHADFLQCVKNRHDPVAPVEAGHAATTLCNLADIALRLKQKVTWDPAAGSFVGNPQANRMRTRAMRGPWSI